MTNIIINHLDRAYHGPITHEAIGVNIGHPQHPAYMMPVYYDTDTECTICFDPGTYQFVVVDCEYDAQARNEGGLFHKTYEAAYNLLQTMIIEADEDERQAQIADELTTMDEALKACDYASVLSIARRLYELTAK